MKKVDILKNSYGTGSKKKKERLILKANRVIYIGFDLN